MIESVTWYFQDVEDMSKEIDAIAFVEEIGYAGNLAWLWPIYNRIVSRLELLQTADVIGMVVSDQDMTQLQTIRLHIGDDRGCVSRIYNRELVTVARMQRPDIVVCKRRNGMNRFDHCQCFLKFIL